MPTPCPDRTRLKDLLDGALPEAEQAALSIHLESCPTCQRAIEELAAGRDTWAGAARQLGQPPSFPDAALAQALERAREARQSGATVLDSELLSELPLDFLDPSDEPGHLGKLDHYDVLELVGRGAMGCVFRAFDQKLRRVVAIKAMSPQLATSASARARFVREGQAAAAICHEHVVAVHAVESARKLPYLVMHYVGGASLQQRIDRTGPLQVKEILRIGMQAAQGLAAAHAQGLVHRDIKPANILLENGVERVKITDFGLARAVDDSSLTQTGVIAGSPQFMAPEQARGDAIDHRADLFSLGSVLYTLCTGRPPFRASTTMAVMKRVCDESPRPIREINSDIPDWLAAIVEKLMAKDPAERFQTAGEVGALLGQHLAHLQQPDRTPRPAPVVRPASSVSVPAAADASRARRTVRPVVVNSVAFAFLGTATILLMLNRHSSPPVGDVMLYAGVAMFAGLAYLSTIGLVALLQRARDRTWKGSLVGAHPFRVALAAAAVIFFNVALMNPGWQFPWQDAPAPAAPQTAPVDAAVNPRPSGDLGLMQGKWNVVSYVPQPSPNDKSQAPLASTGWTITNDVLRTNDGELLSISLNPQTDPKQIDVVQIGRGSGPSPVGSGIYQLDGDRLVVAVGPPGSRPTHFPAAPVGGEALILLSRPRPNGSMGDMMIMAPRTTTQPHVSQSNEAELEYLRQLVHVAEQEFNQIQKQQESGVVPATEVARAEIRLKESQIQLAEAEHNPTRVLQILEELIKVRETEVDMAQQLVEQGMASPTDKAQAERALLQDRIRLERARNQNSNKKDQQS